MCSQEKRVIFCLQTRRGELRLLPHILHSHAHYDLVEEKQIKVPFITRRSLLAPDWQHKDGPPRPSVDRFNPTDARRGSDHMFVFLWLRRESIRTFSLFVQFLNAARSRAVTLIS